MGVLAGALMGLDGHLGLTGWQWLFAVEGFPAVILGAIFFFALPDAPATARWLTEPERNAVLVRIQGRTSQNVSRQAEPIGPALRDPRVWLLGIFNFCMLGSSYAYSFSAPTIVQTLSGLSITGTGFLIAAMYLLGAAAMFGNGILSDRARDTFWYVIPGCLMMSAGFLALALSSNPGIAGPSGQHRCAPFPHHISMGARGTRLEALADNADDQPQLGDPTDVTIRFDGAWRRIEGTIEIPEIHATVAGAALSGSITLRDLDTDPVVDLALGMQHLDFAQLLGASGLAVPESLGMAPGAGRDLGSATIDVRVRGRLADPASLSVSQKIDFRPPREMPPAVARLRGDFIFRSEDGPGPHRPIDVSLASPDFIALRDVPPLFVRTLLLAEDTGFYGHRGIDLRELPAALLTNWSRGGAARGASTITQQLAKNLFLSRDKQLGRKLQELAITFLLESALGKDRILEIYLNIIEWGPDLRGLRPAARRYFGREPRELTPAEMAFLVAIIPGPIKYQSSFAHGTPGPGLRSLIDELLAKLRSVDAIGEEEYRQALDEPIVVAGGRPRG